MKHQKLKDLLPENFVSVNEETLNGTPKDRAMWKKFK